MKKLFLAALAVAVCTACSGKNIVVEVTNPSGFDRTEDIAAITADILTGLTPTAGETYIVTSKKGEVLTSQYTRDGVLIFQPGLKAGETAQFSIATGKAPEYEAKTFGRAYPERYDDFAWENDRVVFRIYGPALKPIDGPSNGMDTWYKRTGALVLDRWYAEDIAGKASYHTDRGEGLDDFKVGRTLGAGAMAPFAGGRLWLNENYASAELLESGPLRTSFRLVYDDVEVDGVKYGETRTISIDAGAQLTRVVQEYGFTRPTDVAAGFPLRPGEAVDVDHGMGWLAYSEPATRLASGVTLGIVMPDGEFTVVDQSGAEGLPFAPHLLMVTQYAADTPVVYYTGYGWDKAGMDRNAFEEYLGRFYEGLKNPLRVVLR